MAFNDSYRNQSQTQRKRKPIRMQLLSLKIWLPLFFIITALLFIMAEYYHKIDNAVPYYIRIIVYFFAATVNVPIGYYILNKCSSFNPQTNKKRRILTIMCVVVAITGFVTASYELMFYYNFKAHPVFGFFLNRILFKEFLYIFVISFSVTLGLIGTYLTFKFKKSRNNTNPYIVH